ncbi:MAG: hypothetical protein JWO38_6994 [Gemmataceae bacterium]|nr:hypothetical protein [Gemmataceae bacterium]
MTSRLGSILGITVVRLTLQSHRRVKAEKKWGTGFGRGLAYPATPVPVMEGHSNSFRNRDSQPAPSN